MSDRRTIILRALQTDLATESAPPHVRDGIIAVAAELLDLVDALRRIATALERPAGAPDLIPVLEPAKRED